MRSRISLIGVVQIYGSISELDPQEKQDREIQRGQLGIDKDPQVKRDQIRQRHEDEEDENP